MILKQLVEMAEREGLIGMPGYAPQPVHWAVDIDLEGRLLSVRWLGQTEVQGEGKKQKAKELVPAQPVPMRDPTRNGTKIVPDLLVDNGKYLFGIAEEDKPVLVCVEASLALHDTLARETGDEAVAAQVCAMRAILDDPAEFQSLWRDAGTIKEPSPRKIGRGNVMIPHPKWQTNHLFGFWLQGEPIWLRPTLLRHRAEAVSEAEEGEQTQCLVTGEMAVASRIHTKIPLPGDTGGLALISFNNDAFLHHGLDQGENAPVSRWAMERYAVSLQRLLTDGYEVPGQSVKLPKRFLRLTNDTTMVYWSGTQEQDACDELNLNGVLEGDRAEDIVRIYRTPHTGRPPLIEDVTPLYTLVFSRAKSRAVLRTAEMQTVGGVARSVLRFVEEFRLDPVPGHRDLIGVRSMLECLLPPGDGPEVPGRLAAMVVTCALDERLNYPAELLSRAVQRIRSAAFAGEQDKQKEYRKKDAAIRLVSMIKAVLIRNYKLELSMSLQPESDITAYQLGRLFATLDRIQGEALGDVNASIADRFMGAAMASPTIVFPRLLKLVQHHLSKLSQDKAGLAVERDRLMGSIIQRLPPVFPTQLSLRDQGCFAVGYYHQRSDFFTKKADKADKPTETV